jgi:hypothetical protein
MRLLDSAGHGNSIRILPRSSSALFAGLCVMLAACGGGGSGASTAPTASSLLVTFPSNTMVSGTNMQASATLDGVAASGVTWTSSDREIITVTGTGLLTATAQGSAVVTATKGSVQGSAIVIVTPGAPVQVRIWAGDQQRATAGSTLAEPLCAVVLDAAGNLIRGLAVTFTVATGGGALAQPTAPVTNAQGIAIAGAWKLGAIPGQQTVVAAYGTLTPVTFVATAQ